MHRPTPFLVLVFILLAPGLLISISAPAQAIDPDYVMLPQSDLRQLAAPVALYPDALLAQIFVACTYPDDVVAAARYLDAGSDPNLIDNQGWDLSVAGVARYPDLLRYLAGNGGWMNDLGAAFLNQQSDLMNAVQVLRGEALAAGNLVSNPEQQVVTNSNGAIEIIPTNAELIYPPIYDPGLVYQPPIVIVGQPYVPLIRFWRGIRVGFWLHHDLDWHDHRVYVGAWGADRPWWHHDAHGGRFDYTHDRPGFFPHRDVDITVHGRDHDTHVRGGEWNRQMHDPKKPLPKVNKPPRNARPDARPGTGYPPRNAAGPGTGGEAVGGVGAYAPGPNAARQRDRGRSSRNAATPHPEGTGNATPAPAGPKPAPAQPQAPVRAPQTPARTPASDVNRHALPPARATPRPAPAPQRVAPAQPQRTPAQQPAPARPRGGSDIRGGAVNGYGNGRSAAGSGDRGASSRGGGGGGGGGGSGARPTPKR